MSPVGLKKRFLVLVKLSERMKEVNNEPQTNAAPKERDVLTLNSTLETQIHGMKSKAKEKIKRVMMIRELKLKSGPKRVRRSKVIHCGQL